MKCVLLVVYLHLVPNLSLPFDLPKPLDRFYDEVVRFYKRVKHEGGKLIKLIESLNKVCYNKLLDAQADILLEIVDRENFAISV